MKKSIIAFALISMMLSACSVYNCPTYMKKEGTPKKNISETRA